LSHVPLAAFGAPLLNLKVVEEPLAATAAGKNEIELSEGVDALQQLFPCLPRVYRPNLLVRGYQQPSRLVDKQSAIKAEARQALISVYLDLPVAVPCQLSISRI
jgi:hypothetical protein